MNTLPRAITAKVLADPLIFHTLRRHWSELIRSSRKRELSAAHHLIYLSLIGKDWRRGFTCITNRRKLDNGAFYGWALFRALAALHTPAHESELLAPFDGLVTPPMLQQIRQLVPVQYASSYRPDQFTPISFPFEAYQAPVQAFDANDRDTNA